MNAEKLEMFRNRLAKVYRHISRQANKQNVTCYRVYDHDLPEFPFCIEIYEDCIYLAEYKRHHSLNEEDYQDWLNSSMGIISEILSVPRERIYLRQRQRKEGRQGQYERLNTAEDFFIVKEAGLQFRVNLTDYLDSGLFLDHRITRQLVREGSNAKNVLNLFCYTGSFSVYAAAGRAARVDSVDLSKTYLAWAEENMKLNELFRKHDHQFIHADVKQWLDESSSILYDIVVMDPPTFSNSKRMEDFLEIQRDHPDLINKTLRKMNPGGILYFSTNFRKFRLESERIDTPIIKDITRATTPFDFQGKLFRYCFRIQKEN